MIKKRILIADDDLGILEVMKIILEDGGFEVVTESKAEKIMETIQETRPDLILIDIGLSGHSGAEITKLLKTNAKVRKTPVLLISANHQTEEIAKECGADGFIAKPFDIDELISISKKYTNLRRSDE